jgi:hypothetical protein
VLAERAAPSLLGLAPGLVRVCRTVEQRLAAHGPWTAGDPGRSIAIEQGAIEQFLQQVMRARGQGFPAVCSFTATGGGDPLLVVADLEPTPAGALASVWFPMPEREPAGGWLALLHDVAEGFGAHHAHLEADDLLMRYQGRRATERARAATPPELRAYIPDPPAFVDGMNLDLLVPQEYDRRQVPAGVWWINYWDRAQIATLGEGRVRGAGWAQVVEAAEGALLLTTTDEPLDLANRAHVERLRLLIDNLGLLDAQRHARYESSG